MFLNPRRLLPRFSLAIALVSLYACKVEVVVPEGGSVRTESGSLVCLSGQTCQVEVSDLFFDENFTATPGPGYRFGAWKNRDRGFFGGKETATVRLYTSPLEGIDLLMSILESDQVFFLEPVFYPAVVAASGPGDWPAYNAELEKLAQVYGERPTTINLDEFWYESLQIPADMFSTRYDELQTSEQPEHGVGYGSFVALDGNRQLVFYSNWVPGSASAGSALALEYDNGVPVRLDVMRNEGATHSWVLDNGDGSSSVVFMGVDEGKLPDRSDAPIIEYDIAGRVFRELGIRSASHSSVPFDYDADGDEDVVAQSWGPPFDTNFVLQNNGGTFEAVQLAQWGDAISGMSLAPYHVDASLKLGLVVTDAVPDARFGVDLKRNFTAELSADLSAVENVALLPTAYFDRPAFTDVPQVIPDWDNDVGKSHDVSAKVLDVDYDGDDDVVISSMIWSDEFPYVVLQILINRDGQWVDETDTRLFNWSLPGGGAHRVDFRDVNGDGFVDILVSDHGVPWRMLDSAGVDHDVGGGSRVLVNDGTGHFAVVAHAQILGGDGFLPSHVPFMDAAGELNWAVMDTVGSNQVRVITRSLNMRLSTGPNGIDPADFGAPGFNEFYYLLHNADVVQAVRDGDYDSGLQHYLALGRNQGRAASAPGGN